MMWLEMTDNILMIHITQLSHKTFLLDVCSCFFTFSPNVCQGVDKHWEHCTCGTLTARAFSFSIFISSSPRVSVCVFDPQTMACDVSMQSIG